MGKPICLSMLPAPGNAGGTVSHIELPLSGLGKLQFQSALPLHQGHHFTLAIGLLFRAFRTVHL
jgi:hypothetical protein